MSAPIPALSELVPRPDRGRSFEREVVPGLADATASGRVRLDAIARWLQDIAYADIVDAGLAGRGAWVVRRARLRVEAFPRFGEPVVVRTFCSAAGRVAAERRTTVSGGAGSVERWRSGSTSTPRRFARSGWGRISTPPTARARAGARPTSDSGIPSRRKQ